MLRTVEDLAGHTIAIDAAAPGRELSRLFELHPGLPGVLIRKKGQVETAISYQQFLKQIVRPFGAELYLGRPVEILVTHLESRLLEIDSGTPITDAVQRCLSRRSALLYEPFLVRSTESALIVDFQTLLLALTDQLSARNQQMDPILSAVSAGLLVIDHDLHIGEEYSRALTAMLEQESLGGQSLIELLATITDEKTAGQAKEYLAAVFNPRVIDRLIRSINPLHEVEARFDSGARTKMLNFAFERLRSGYEISHLLVSVEDVTENIRLTRELAAQQQRAEHRLKIILQILEIESEDLNPFLHRFEALLSLARATVESVSPDQPEFARQLYRTAHALKGEAGILGLTVFQEAIHEFEDGSATIRSRSPRRHSPRSAMDSSGLISSTPNAATPSVRCGS
jgi:hypothetical protein